MDHDVLEFIARLVEALAWPVVLVVVAIIFRERLRDILSALARRMGSLRKLSGMGMSAEFAEELEQAQEDVNRLSEELRASDEEVRPGAADRLKSLELLAEVAPEAAVMEAFRSVEASVIGAAQRTGWQRRGRGGPIADAMHHLREHVSPSVGTSLDRLRHLRNEVVHSSDTGLPSSVAADYVRTAWRLAQFLDEFAANQ